ncbi:ATP-binding protein [Stenotrophomonas pennii]|uniref:ATP-binding protein n=1 Tax=Stenotrophomonas lacuserhaii TaxID=2760084 RepID=UPI00320AF65C
MDLNFQGPLTRVVVVEETTQVGQARREALRVAAEAGFDEIDAGRVALAATEMATNLWRHGGGGRMLLSVIAGSQGNGVELCSIDQGPGFVLGQCLQDGYSTGGSQGLGMGAIARQARVMDLWCDARGAVLVVRIHRERAPRDADLAYGAVRLPMKHELACGDAWHLRMHAQQLVLTVIDGLGHGAAAAEASEAGVRALAAQSSPGSAVESINDLHAALSGSRGGAAAVACLALDSGAIEYAGVGNIAGSLLVEDGSRGMASMPGIVGVQYRKAQAFGVHAAAGTLLVMHSDGLQARWSLRDYPGLQHRHPALVVAVLQRDFDRGRDDVCIVALRVGALK